MVSARFSSMKRYNHQIGTLEPEPGNHPVYAQYYLYDGDDATEHRFARNPDLDQNILRALEPMLRAHNPFRKTFQFAYEVLQTARVESVRLQVFEDCYRGTNGSESV